MARTGKTRTRAYITRACTGSPRTKSTRRKGGSQWHSSRITVETGPSDRGQHAHAPRKNKEKRRRRLRCAKPSARQPKPRRMRSKRPGSLEGLLVPRNTAIAVQRMWQDLRSLSASGASTTGIHAPSCAHGRKLLNGKPSIAMPFDASTRATMTQCKDLRRIDGGIRVDVAAAVT